MWSNWNLPMVLAIVERWYKHLRNMSEVYHKVKANTYSMVKNSSSRYYPKEVKMCPQKTCISMLIAALFIITKYCKQPNVH